MWFIRVSFLLIIAPLLACAVIGEYVPITAEIEVVVSGENEKIHTRSISTLKRDRRGNTRLERGSIVFISSDRSSNRTILHPDQKLAQRFKTTASPADSSITSTVEEYRDSVIPLTIVSDEDLGLKSIDGIECHGRKVVAEVPTGPIISTTIRIERESWYSGELQLPLLTRTWDSKSSRQIIQRIRIVDRDDPGDAYFRIPADYKIDIVEPLGDRFENAQDMTPELGARAR